MILESKDAAATDDGAKPAVPNAVEEAVRTLIRWAGDDPLREGLRDRWTDGSSA